MKLMKFGVFVSDRKVELVRGFVEEHPMCFLEMVEVRGGVYVACQGEYQSLDSPGAFEAVSALLAALNHINDVEKSVSVIDVAAGTAESNLEHIRRLHRERESAPGAILLGNLRAGGREAQGFDG